MSSSQNKVKSYETAGERRGRKQAEETRSLFRPLEFDHCALTLQPFRDPVLSNVSGAVYDITSLVPFVQQHKIDPISGEKMTLKDITKLHFHRLESGKYGCPATFKEFTDHSHIVAIRTSGNVYSMDAVRQLNINANNWTDLISGEPFTKSDIVTIQDPSDPARRNVNSFHHVKFGTKFEKKDQGGIRTDPSMRRVLGKMKEEREAADEAEKEVRKREREELAALGVTMPEVGDEEPAKGMTSADFTSLGFVGKKETTVMIPGKKTRRKGSVRLYTTCGQLDLTLHADLVPVACENFLRHCAAGYYTGTKFHRLIKGFMIQGGDPTASGRGGDSVWKRHFQDEFVRELRHDKRGVLSMANSGPNTNRSQFFITFSRRPHLDDKHTVFGQVTGGLETLDEMEAMATGHEDRPLFDIVIKDTAVLFDPFLHLEDEAAEEVKVAEEAKSNEQRGEWFSNITKSYPKPALVKEEGAVGKYLVTIGDASKGAIDFGSAAVSSSKKRPKKGGDFGANF